MIFIPILVCAGFSAGVVNMNREERPEKLWLLPDDWVLEARTYRQTYFERALEETLIITSAEPDGDVLAKNKLALNSSFNLHNAVMNIAITVKDPQGKPRTFTTNDLCLQSDLPFVPVQPCLVTTVLAFWNYDPAVLAADKDPHQVVSWDNATDPMTGGPLFREQVVGGLTLDDGVVESAAAFKFWYYLNNNFTINDSWQGWQDDVLGAWEDAFLALASQSWPGITVYRHASKSDGAVMADAMENDLPFVIAALMTVVFVVVFYIFMSPALFHDGLSPRFGERALRSFCAVVAAALSMGASMGVTGVASLPFSGVVWYMIFYVLIHLCHGMGLLVNALDVICVAMPTNTRLGAALATVGPTMLTSTLPIVLVFSVLAGLPSALPCVRTLALVGAFGLSINLMLIFSFFLAILSMNIRRLHATRPAASGLATAAAEERPPCVGVRAIMRFYRWACRSWLAKSLVVLAVLGMAGDSINGCIAWRQTASEAAVYPQSSYLAQFFLKDQAYFDNIKIPVDVVVHPTNYGAIETGRALVDLAARLEQNKYMDPNTPPDHYTWYNSFLAYLGSKNITLPGGLPVPAMFDGLYSMWSHDYGEPMHTIFEFMVDLHNDGPNNTLGHSRFQVFSAPLTDMETQAAAVDALHDLTSSIGLTTSLYAPPFYIFRTFTTVRQWAVYALIATGAGSAASVALSLGPLAAVCVLLAIASAGLNTVGLFMHSAGYSLDTTTLPMIMFMLPLITELLVHLAAFLRVGSRLPPAAVPFDGDKPRNSLLAASAAVLSYGPATATLVCGGLGTLIGLGVMLAGVASPVLVIFGALTSVIVALACFHVVVLPLFLSW